MKTHRTYRAALVLLLVVSTLVLAPRLSAADLPTNLVVLVSSDFEMDADGWTGTNGNGGSEIVVYKAGGATSNSVGFIGINETVQDGTLSFLVAPPKFHGDKRAAYNGYITFHHRQNKTGNLSDGNRLVVIGADTNCLSYDLSLVPDAEWNLYVLPLNEHSGWRIGVITNITRTTTSNKLATREDFARVLAAIDRVHFKAEYSGNNNDQVDLDDVQFLGQPSGPAEPTLGIATYAGVTINGAVGSTYAIEYRNALDVTTNWLPLTNIVLPSTPYLFTDTNSPSAASRFYRAVLQP